MKYDGDASISPHGRKFRVWVEAPNVTAEVYISREKAREILRGLDWDLNGDPATRTALGRAAAEKTPE